MSDYAKTFTMTPAEIEAENLRLTARVAELERVRNSAYTERNQCVALIATMARLLGWNAGIARHPEEDKSWEDDWRTLAFIDLPSGQVSWHFHDSECNLLSNLPVYRGTWDGHDTPEKYRRVRAALTPARAEGEHAVTRKKKGSK